MSAEEEGDVGASAYRRAGVDIDAQDRALSSIKELVRSTATPGVLSELGSFGGLFRPDLAGLEEPVLVASADGVGTKLMVARLAGDYSTVGRDLVNHCVNDILVQGARPLFFLDYVGAGVLDEVAMRQLVGGVAAGCRENRCALLGGETAEMPGFYQPGDYELVGFIVGLVDRPKLLDGSRVRDGDRLIGLAAAGLHTNGFSLARRALLERAQLTLDSILPGDHRALRDVLLAPHPSYLAPVGRLLDGPGLHALAHITGGGLTDNLPRVLPAGLTAIVERGTWPAPIEFEAIQSWGEVGTDEMYRVFNMGIGLVLVMAPEACAASLASLASSGQRAWEIGRVEAAMEGGDRGVRYRDRG
ncbi:MAG TPA: phosphoribosylformylglycinamidine cyclo-ligase [Thermoanaerobaculia bacterium]|nr:phosphoribosylformylglycinamidine cyclo-ligase [Thermoanaerobaculia bacterium]